MTYNRKLLQNMGLGSLNFSKYKLRRFRIMNSESNIDSRDHSKITANQPRQDVISKATIVDSRMESPTVKTVRLQVDHPGFSFRAGQWVDLFIPGIEQVGGFSMCSSPTELQRNSVIDLAVKMAKYPPAYWIHTQCRKDQELRIRSGGEFFYDNKTNKTKHNLLLIGGGVGINPLASIYRYCADLHRNPADSIYLPGRVLLMFSSSNTKELLFKDDFKSISDEIPALQHQFFVTKENDSQHGFEKTRINQSHLRKALDLLGKENTLCYICGPPPMIADMDKLLLDLGVEESRIRYEKWW